MSEMSREERLQGYAAMTEMVAEQLVKALQADVFPDEETGKMFGIVMNYNYNDGIGNMLYRAYTEIFKHRKFHARGQNFSG